MTPPRSGEMFPHHWQAAFFAILILAPPEAQAMEKLKLPQPAAGEPASLEGTLARRRSVREFSGKPLTVEQLSRLLWSAQGITDALGGKRTAPSAGALYPLEVYAVLGVPVPDAPLKAGVYRYLPREHSLTAAGPRGDQRQAVARAALSQNWMGEAPVIVLIAGDFSRTTIKYGDRGIQYVHQEAGAAAQNFLLEAQALGIKAGIVGAFRDDDLSAVLSLPHSQTPLLLLPVGP